MATWWTRRARSSTSLVAQPEFQLVGAASFRWCGPSCGEKEKIIITGTASSTAGTLTTTGVALFGPLEAPAEVDFRVNQGNMLYVADSSQDTSTPAGVSASHAIGDNLAGGSSPGSATRIKFRMNQGETLYCSIQTGATNAIASWLVSYV